MLDSRQLQLTAAEIREVRTILDSVVGEMQVLVFGSRATGQARPFSDLDLLIVKPGRLSWAQRAELRDRFEASALPFRVDFVEAEGLPPAWPRGWRARALRCTRPSGRR